MKIKKNELIYYVAFIIFEFITLCGNSVLVNLGSFTNILILVTNILFLFKIMQSRYILKEWLLIGLVSIICLYISVVSKNLVFITTCLAIFAIKDIDINKLIKLDLTMKLLFFIPHLILYSIDIFLDIDSLVGQLMLNINGNIRYSFYFTHPNAAGGIIISILMDIIILNKDKPISYIICTILSLIFLKLTKSRTASYLFLIFLLIVILAKKENSRKIIKKGAFLLVIVLIIVSLYITQIHTDQIWENQYLSKINELLSWRVSLSTIAVERYGIHILPNTISDGYIDEYLIVDNFYIRSFINYGAITLLILFEIYYLCRNKRMNNIEVAILCILPIYLFLELYPINIARTVIMLIIGNLLINDKGESKKDENFELGKE